MRIAVIDLGTNTFNLLIADWINCKIHQVYTTKVGVALGMGGILKNEISVDAMNRAIECLKNFKHVCNELEVRELYAIATSAVRDAHNKDIFCERVCRETGIFVEVVSGLREAELIWKGISYSHHFTEKSLIMDIGGGSTEFILSGDRGIISSASFNIGLSRIFQARNFQDPLSNEDIQMIEQFLEKNTNSFFGNLNVDIIIGASGSFETFYEMWNHCRYPEGFSTQHIPFDKFMNILNILINSKEVERDQHPFIIPIRKKMVPIAAVKTRWVVNKIRARKLIISPCSLKEGVFVEMGNTSISFSK
jgi:exopolyphosphatase / guanosine-5'-triphosphate,3'-diphosphate pyrophosphatase